MKRNHRRYRRWYAPGEWVSVSGTYAYPYRGITGRIVLIEGESFPHMRGGVRFKLESRSTVPIPDPARLVP